ncbi:unnamed protein product (macronuclear) [Paramecium tetraurelia]|uniref:Uncharacterized protein n=1 Tax=Paramecium tetraurelia TaxID=5888 RepID=A0BRA2_PARTE|nr:uncharacterized protein GSPATT00031300001 [Paramecium tetraurelia]CAK61069.1 unnamed protein product [Paramecium tetraurelia]|eukprot:XP_001428467.1 hypothetical protein (macronuclear) [Paramecium tetraurelia strain d4-2]
MDEYMKNFFVLNRLLVFYYYQLVQMTDSTCPFCKNNGYFDQSTSSTYCKTKSCNNRVIQFGTINYEDENKLGDVDQPGNRQSRNGGYENKIVAYKEQLCEKQGISDSKQRKQFQEKFEAGEHQIYKLNRYFNMNEAFTNDAIYKYRFYMKNISSEISRKTFLDISSYVFYLTIKERQSKHYYDQKLGKITLEEIAKYSNKTAQQIKQAIRVLNNKTIGFTLESDDRSQQDICQQIALKIQKHNLPFTEDETFAIKDIPRRLMDSSIIRGEKTSTIAWQYCILMASVAEFMVSQLSSNPRLNMLTIDQLAQMNEVQKDTVKKLWNAIIDNQSSQNHISRWEGQRSITELKHIN